jgi:hypothetical protein
MTVGRKKHACVKCTTGKRKCEILEENKPCKRCSEKNFKCSLDTTTNTSITIKKKPKKILKKREWVDLLAITNKEYKKIKNS